MAVTPFCIDIQEKYLRICDSKVSQDKVELVSLGIKDSVPFFYTSDSHEVIKAQADIISQLYSNSKIKKTNVNIVMPDAFTYSQIVQMPLLNEKELLSAIRYQSDEFIPMPIEETSLDVEILREDPKEKKLLVLIIAAPKQLVARIEKTIEMVGLQPVNLENEATSIGRLFTEKMSKIKKDHATLVINFGYTSSSFYLIDPVTSLIVLMKGVKIGLDIFLRDVKVNLNADEQKCLEILKTVGFANNGPVNITNIIMPIFKELLTEIQKFIVLSKDRFNLQIGEINLFNYSDHIALLSKMIEANVSLPASELMLTDIAVQNPVYQSNSADISSFISSIGGSL